MLGAALVLSPLALCVAVVLVARAKLAAADRIDRQNIEAIAELRRGYERERAEWRLALAEKDELAEKRELAWRHERMHLLTRIQAPQLAIAEAYSEADELARTQARDGLRPEREVNFSSEDLDARSEHVEQAQARLAELGLSIEDVRAGAAAARGDTQP